MKLHTAATTHRGYRRAANEDGFHVDSRRQVYAVADGLGGLPEGALASRTALESIASACTDSGAPTSADDLVRLIQAAQEAVIAAGHRKQPEIGIGTTLTLAAVRPDHLLLAHVGDSAAFRWREGRLKLLTPEHNLAALYHQSQPRDAMPAHYSHTLTQCLGSRDGFAPHFAEHPLQAGDRYLLCTDGVCKPLGMDFLAGLLREAKTADEAASTIEEAVLAAGAPDNLALIALFCERA